MEKTSLHILHYEAIAERLSQKAQTNYGKKLARQIAPADDFSTVSELLAQTSEAYNLLSEAAPPFGGIVDLRHDLKQISLGIIAAPESLLRFSNTFYGLRNLKKFFKQHAKKTPCLTNWAMQIEILGQLEADIDKIIDESGAIKDDATPELYKIRQALTSAKNRLKSSLNGMLHDSTLQKYFQDNIVTVRDGRYVIPVKQEYRQFVPGVIHDQSASGSTIFVEPLTVTNLNNDIREFSAREKREIERIMRLICAKIAKASPQILKNCRLAAMLDFVFAKGRLARSMNASYPELNDKGIVNLKKARQPLLEPHKVVPIDIVLGKDFQTLLITGPNTGGKTVSLKTLGLLSLMAQSGLFIPAEEGSALPVYKNIFADIGDEQSLEQNLSTFSAHMTHIIDILKRVQKGDLVLLDEMGSGTDPEEGAGLAIAILENLIQKGASIVGTTHYNELKTYAYSQPGIENASVEFDTKTLRPTYRLLIGVPGSSNAFSISERLGLPPDVVARARQVVKADHANFERVLNTLETQKSHYETKNMQIKERERQISITENELLSQKGDFEAQKAAILQKAQSDSAALIREARREANYIIKELKAQFKENDAQKRLAALDASRKLLREAASKYSDFNNSIPAQGTPVDLKKLRIGDSVHIKKLNKDGIVEAINGKELSISLGGLKTTVKASDCLFAAPKKEAKKEISQPVRHNFSALNKAANISRQVDIRGMMVDEACEVLDKYIDDALLAGLKEIIIIHGKGTGALRKGVHDYLKKHRNVASYGLADINEGGSGATVARFC